MTPRNRPGPADDPHLPEDTGRAGDSHGPEQGKTKRTFRLINWILTRSHVAAQTIYIYTCLTCGESESADKPEPAELWALKHSGKTWHTSYAEDMRTFHITTPVDLEPDMVP